MNVPDFSYAFAAGNTTSAITAVSVRNMSCTTTKLFENAKGSMPNCSTGFDSHDVKRLQIAGLGAFDHLRQSQAGRRRYATPFFVKLACIRNGR